jgi:hypothetical protein
VYLPEIFEKSSYIGAHNIFYESDINRSIAFAAIYRSGSLVYGEPTHLILSNLKDVT